MKKRVIYLLIAVITVFNTFWFSGCNCSKEKENITTYEIEVSLEENLIVGKAKVDFYNHTENVFKELKFNLFANAFRKEAKYSPISAGYYSKAYYKGESYGDIKISSVIDKNGELNYYVGGKDQNVLIVNLNQEVFPNERVSVEIEYVVKLANVIARTGITERTINLANFYPILCGIEDQSFYECVYYANGDPYFSDVANYEVTFTYPKEYVVASTGVVKSSKELNEKVTAVYKANSVRSFCMVLSKDFEILTSDVDGVNINYYYYDDDNPKQMLDTAIKSMKYFSSTFGKYPYSNYSFCQTPFLQGGMEFPQLTFISEDLEEKAYKEVIVHETAHQWWQTGVGNNEIEHGFLDEGLTEYSVVLFYENHPEYGFNRKNLIEASEKTYKAFCSVYDKLFGGVNTTMIRNLGEFNSEYEYVNLAYVKPCIMFDGLRESIGDDKFFSSLKKYYEEYLYKNATPYDLVSVFEKRVGEVEGYFESFFSGKVIL